MEEHTQVIICGGGPTGALLSALLATHHVPNIVLEREEGITTDPRGIALDEDGIRALQAIGIYDRIFSEIGSTMLKFNFISGTEKNFYKRPLLSMDYSTSEGGTGHVGFICHKQPMMEKAIRDAIDNSPYSQLRSKCLVTGVNEDDENVTVRYTDANGQSRSVQGKFLVGADGKTGYVRKKYLEPRGITLDKCEGTNYDETWVALNWKITPPTEKTHPNFPLWRLGYTPTEVYDSFIPKEFRFLCNPDRPSVCGRFGLESDRLWRFEFVVHKDEDGQKMASWEETSKIILPYLTHPGSRYGLQYDVQFPTDCIEVLRSRPFSFQARSCNKWALGRVILAGDAAHVFPPFGGQGIASGFRDAFGLAWRLALLHQEPHANHVEILKAWYIERKQQLERSLAATIRNGEYVTSRDPYKNFVREWVLWFAQLLPSWRREIEKGARVEGMTRYKHAQGLPFLPDGHGGLLLPQVYAMDSKTKRVRFTDDLIFAPRKRGLLQLVVLPGSIEETSDLLESVKGLTDDKFLVSDEATVLIQDHTIVQPQLEQFSGNDSKVFRIATADEFAADPIICRNRPPPKYYDPYRMSKEVKGSKFVLVRPDRFVFAACGTRNELEAVLVNIKTSLLP